MKSGIWLKFSRQNAEQTVDTSVRNHLHQISVIATKLHRTIILIFDIIYTVEYIIGNKEPVVSSSLRVLISMASKTYSNTDNTYIVWKMSLQVSHVNPPVRFC